MPVRSCVSPDGQTIITIFHEKVTPGHILAQSDEVVRAVVRDAPFNVLLIFDPSVDLSEIDTAAINRIRQARQEQFRRHKVRRGAGAAVIGATQAAMILPLWNALAEADPEQPMNFAIFETIEPALDHLGIPQDEGKAIVRNLASPPPAT